jgi:acetyltransferase-like isoleucine patch superfamily enzyme
MKKLIGLFSLLFLWMVMPASVSAKVVIMETGTYTVEEGEVINDDLFIGAESVEILGTVNGDVYVGTATFTMDGDISGDLFVGAGTVNISGSIGDDLRIGSGNIYIQETTIGDGVSIGGGSIIIDKDTTIGGSFLAGAGTLTSRASVGRNVMVGAGNVVINGPVGGEMRVAGEKVQLGSDTVIQGDLTYDTGENEIEFVEGATVSGAITKTKSKFTGIDEEKFDKFDVKSEKSLRTINGGFQLFSFFGALVIGLVTLAFLQKPAIVMADTLGKNIFKSFGVGLLVFVLAGPLFIVLMMTVVGIPLVGILIPLYLIDLCLAKLVTSFYLGRYATEYLGKKKVSVYASFSLGLILYYLLRVIPYVGVLTRIVALFAGLGAMYIASWKWIEKQKK